MKKYISLFTALLLMFSFAACGPAVTPVIDNPDLPDPNTTVNSNTNFPTVTPSKGYMMENSTETKKVYSAVYPINESTYILQFDVINLPIGEDIPDTMTYALAFVKNEENEYIFSETDQNGDNVSLSASFLESNELMISGNEFLDELTGIYEATEEICDVADVTVLYFLRNVPEAGIGDFALYSPMDEIECYTMDDWFINSNLYSEGEFKYSFLVAKDFSVIINTSTAEPQVIYGNLDNTLNATYSYETFDEENELIKIEEPVICPAITCGNTLTEGMVGEVYLKAPYDLTKSLEITSDNNDVLSVNGTEITANAIGNAKLTIKADYCGSTKEYEFDVEVIEKTDSDNSEDSSDDSYVESKYTTYFDKTSMRATMDICFEDGFISVDIMWADDAWTEHHWSYVGNGNPEDTEFTLIGRYTIDCYTDDGFFSEEVVAENISATLSLGKDNCYYWYDLNEDTDHECVFELPEL